MGFVYFIVADAPKRMVKIGYTAGHPIDRLRALQTGSPVQLEVVAFVEGAIALEQKRHRTFRKLRTQGEWFVCEGKLQELVWYLSDEFGKAAPPGTFDAAIHDVVLADLPPHPAIDADYFRATADPREWLAA